MNWDGRSVSTQSVMRENDKLRDLLDAVEQELSDLERRLPDGPRFVCLDELRRVLGKAE